MIEREDFFSLFFPTVEQYYYEVYNKTISLSFAKKTCKCNMIIKPFLSAATYLFPSNAAREFFYSEWNIRNSIWKNILAKTYISIITRTGILFSQYRFCFQPSEEMSRDIVIAPNNRSIRIFDYHTRTVGCIIKKGFTSKYFQNQLMFRIHYKYDFMVPLLDYGSNWFVEPILSGHPLARVTNTQAYDDGISNTLSSMSTLAKDTMSFQSVNEYIQNLSDKIRVLVNESLERKNIRFASETLRIIEYVNKKSTNQEWLVPLCVSHGDLQTGNIWVGHDKKTLIYDWETVGERSVWYDCAVLCYSLRRTFGWEAFLQNINTSNLLFYDPEKERDLQEIEVIKLIVLLEDIIFYLEDMLELPKDWGNNIYDLFLERVYKLILKDCCDD